MIWWTGVASAHITYLPRKPTPLGIQLKTCVDATSGVCVNMELCESKEDMKEKKWFDEYGATTSCTLRLTEQYHHQNREVIGDSWFGSVRTAEALLARGLHSVLNVKMGHSGFPKKELLSMATTRGKRAHMVKLIKDPKGLQDKVPVYASVHIDKHPMLLVHTCRTTRPGLARVRRCHRFHNGAVTTKFYTLE